MEIIEVDCQTIKCKNKVKIEKNSQYYGIFCKECLKRQKDNVLKYVKINEV
jgi:hypothetical protein